MEDYMVQEIRKIGKVLEALLSKIGLLKKSNATDSLCAISKTELLDRLDLNLEKVLEQENLVEVLISVYGFNLDELEQFAALLYELVIASQEQALTIRCVAAIRKIYQYLDENGAAPSFYRYCMLKEMKQYME